MIGVRCQCGSHLKVPESAIGTTGKCPFCKTSLKLVAPNLGVDSLHFNSRLVIEQGLAHVGQQLALGGPGPIEIGKVAGKDIVLKGGKVSRLHCRLVRSTSGGWRIEDQESANGLYVNDQRVSHHELRDGDVIRIGEYVLRHSSTQPAARPGSSADEQTQLEQTLEADVSSTAQDTAKSRLEGTLYDLGQDYVPPPPEPEEVARICPTCGKGLPKTARICIDCGTDLKTGRLMLTSHAADLDSLYINTEGVVRWLSLYLWFGIFPISSEGFGTRRPYVTWAVTLLTVGVSVWFWCYEWSGSPEMYTLKNLMLWSGDVQPEPELLVFYYGLTPYGDKRAFATTVHELRKRDLAEPKEQYLTDGELFLAAHESLTPEQQCFGRFRRSQLITSAFLHNDIMHLVGNMVFLLVIGSRVNALVGNSATVLLYPLLAVASGVAHLLSTLHSVPCAALGASGAIMGLAGMYLVLMPIHKLHMAWWFRFFFYLRCRLFVIRGFWLVIVYIAFDVLATLSQSADEVAHWAHLGGFIVGVVLGLILLFTRVVNCRGGDVVTSLLGKQAWPLVGKPNLERKAALEHVW